MKSKKDRRKASQTSETAVSLSRAQWSLLSDLLAPANSQFAADFPGESSARQPVHTVYGGAHLFKSDTTRKLGDMALRAVAEYAPNFATLARVCEFAGAASLPESDGDARAALDAIRRDPAAGRKAHSALWLASTVHDRMVEKLKVEPVEDYRIDFEDGYGNRPDSEEDDCAAAAAREVRLGAASGSLPPFIGIRIKPMSADLWRRGLRTLDLFLTELVSRQSPLPPNFVVTIPKVVSTAQVQAVVSAIDTIERKTRLKFGSVKIELMIETTQSIIDGEGRCPLLALVQAGGGRCVAAHFGVYDYTACCSITAAHQHMRHPACDFARSMMQVALAGTGIMLSDGATNIMPIAPHRAAPGQALSAELIAENRATVHRAWRIHAADIRHSLARAFYQGWDLNPAQLPTRYAAVYAFFLAGLDSAAERLRNFVDKAAQATLVGDVFDDAATGQGLLNFFLRGLGCGAITEQEAMATGLTLTEIRSRSFLRILESRRSHHKPVRRAT